MSGIHVPPEVPAEHVDEYVTAVRKMIACGCDPEKIARGYSAFVNDMLDHGVDPFDPALWEPAEMSIEDTLRWLEET
jgi:hypothetical protein